MKVKVGNKIKNFRTIWIEGKTVKMINQLKLPEKFEIFSSYNYKQTIDAIKRMIVRGAPAIGVAAAYGMVQATFDAPQKNFDKYMQKVAKKFKNARPTGHNLFWAVDRVLEAIKNYDSLSEKKMVAMKEANKIATEDVETCKKIGKYGSKLVKDGDKILTHCNAGALGTVDFGTALAVIRFAHYQGKKIFVFVDETRPRCQGSKLTAWELLQEGINHAIITDNAAGYFMQKGEIDICIVGADRILKDGTTANKIGTYEKAVLAKENGIPFYVAAPTSTFDFESKEIQIEERSEEEVVYVFGFDERGQLKKVRITPRKSKALNPAFDITPPKFITGFITEKGTFKPTRLRELLNPR